MSPNTIRDMIRAVIPECKVETAGEDCNFSIVVTSPVFAGMSPLARHRMVNDVFKAQFASGELHALSIKTKAE
jgi:acid stress-induced BolA-like protein IbaG/YrbA